MKNTESFSASYKRYFRHPRNCNYLNAGTESLLPDSVMESLFEERRRYEKNPTASWIASWSELWATQKNIAQFFNADPKDLFFRHNITESLNEFILGMPLPKNSEIVVTSLEYQAIVNICEYRAKKDNLSLRCIALPTDLATLSEWKSSDWVDYIVSQLSPKTSMLLISQVMTCNALRIDLEKLSQETRKKGVLLVVDAAHGTGALETDFSKMEKVDFYGGNFHKWIMGPKGTGFGWAAKQHQESLQPLLGGWTTFQTYCPFETFGEESRFALKMIPHGTRDFTAFRGLNATLALWQEIGPEKIRKEIFDRRALIQKTADEILKLKPLSPLVDGTFGPLVTYEVPASLQERGYRLIHEILEQTNVQVALPKVPTYDLKSRRLEPKWGLRLSSHLWADQDDIIEGIQKLRPYFL